MLFYVWSCQLNSLPQKHWFQGQKRWTEILAPSFLLVWSSPSPSLCPFQEIRGILPTLSSLLGYLRGSAGWVDVEELEQLESDADMEIQGLVWAHAELGTKPGGFTHEGKREHCSRPGEPGTASGWWFSSVQPGPYAQLHIVLSRCIPL